MGWTFGLRFYLLVLLGQKDFKTKNPENSGYSIRYGGTHNLTCEQQLLPLVLNNLAVKHSHDNTLFLKATSNQLHNLSGLQKVSFTLLDLFS